MDLVMRNLMDINAIRSRLQLDQHIRKFPTFHPEKNWYCRNWDGVVSICLIFTCVITPYEVAFLGMPRRESDPPGGESGPTLYNTLWWANRVVDVVFFLDMCLQFFLKYPIATASGVGAVWCEDPKMIARNYCKTWFPLDLVSIIPFDMIGSAITGGANKDSSKLRAIKVIRCLRLLKLVRIVRASRIIKRWETKFGYPKQKVDLSWFLAMLVVVGHFLACVWGLVGNIQDQDLSGSCGSVGYTESNWIDKEYCKTGDDSPSGLYAAALHWAFMTLTSIGYGDIVPVNTGERLLGILCMLVSGCLWAALLGSATNIMGSLDESRLLFNSSVDEMNGVMTEKDIPHELQREVRGYVHQKRVADISHEFKNMLDNLSPLLQGKVCLFTNARWITNVAFLTAFGVSRELEASIAMNMTLEFYARKECFGQAWSLYVLNSGLVVRKCAQFKFLRSGSIWGEDIVLSDITLVQTNEVTCFNFSEVMKLHKTRYTEVCKDHPDDAESLRKYVVRLAVARGMRREAAIRVKKQVEAGSNKQFEDRVGVQDLLLFKMSLVEDPSKVKRVAFLRRVSGTPYSKKASLIDPGDQPADDADPAEPPRRPHRVVTESAASLGGPPPRARVCCRSPWGAVRHRPVPPAPWTTTQLAGRSWTSRSP